MSFTNALARAVPSLGYHQVKEKTASYVTTHQEEKDLELGDLGRDSFYDEVSTIRQSLQAFDASVENLSGKHVLSITQPNPEHLTQIKNMTDALHADSAAIKSKIAHLGGQVGKDEARRGHFDVLKGTFQRSVTKWQLAEKAQRQRVRDRVARQFKIVKPEATEAEVQQVLESPEGGQVFMNAVAGSRSEHAQSALNEAKARRQEVQQIEETLIELSQLMIQVAEIVAVQDTKFISVEESARMANQDIEEGAKQLGVARVSAAAHRHRRKLCCAFFSVIVIVLVVVIVIQVGPSKKDGEAPPAAPPTDGSAPAPAPAAPAAPAGENGAAPPAAPPVF